MRGSRCSPTEGGTAVARGDRIDWLGKVIALFDIANERLGLERCIESEPYLRNPKLGMFKWRMEFESRVLPRIGTAERQELSELMASAWEEYSWQYIQTSLDDSELQALREEYERCKDVVERHLSAASFPEVAPRSGARKEESPA